MSDRPRHPGRTAAQRRALDAIGCGNASPIMAKSTKDAMLNAGLIELCGFKHLPVAGALMIQIAEYQMPIPIHMAWCGAVAAEEIKDAP